MKTRRVTVKGLRGADVATLRVLTQDVLALPLNQLDAVTLCDLVALSELEEGLPKDLDAELKTFRDRRFREVADLPDGPALGDFAQQLTAVKAADVPSTIREMLSTLIPDCAEPEAVAALESLMKHLETEEPAIITLAEGATEKQSKAEKAVEDRAPAKSPPKKKKSTRKTAPAKDPARAEWIEEYVMLRLVNYETGLKEAIVVGGARFKAPWKDITEREVRSVLRRLAREEKLRTSAGRWLIER